MFQRHAAKHAEDWSKYMSDRRTAPNGSLYLITGCIKSGSWGIRTISGNSTLDYLELIPSELPPDGSQGIRYRWQKSGNVLARMGPSSPDMSIPTDEPNQTTFLRGYKIMLQREIWERTTSTITMTSSESESTLSQHRQTDGAICTIQVVK